MDRHPVPLPAAVLSSPPNTPPSLTGSSSHDQDDAPGTNAQIPYSPTFTDALMKHILSLPASTPSTARRGAAAASKTSKEDGIIVLPLNSTQSPVRGVSIRLQDVDPASLPNISPDTLPLPLDDPRRVYASGVPGVRLTHPGGWLEGGPGPSPAAMDMLAVSDEPTDAPRRAPSLPGFARAFFEQHDIATPAALRAHVSAAVAAQLDELKRCMRQRDEAIKKNEKLEREIADLVAEREMERRVHERQMKVRREKMEEREREKLRAG